MTGVSNHVNYSILSLSCANCARWLSSISIKRISCRWIDLFNNSMSNNNKTSMLLLLTLPREGWWPNGQEIGRDMCWVYWLRKNQFASFLVVLANSFMSKKCVDVFTFNFFKFQWKKPRALTQVARMRPLCFRHVGAIQTLPCGL